MHVWRLDACCLLVVDEEGATTTCAFRACTSNLHPASQSSRACTSTSTSRYPKTETTSYVTSRSPSAIMEFDKAPEHMTKGGDELYLRRAEWASEMESTRAELSKGRERLYDSASAAETMKNLVDLASNLPQMSNSSTTDATADQIRHVSRCAPRAGARHVPSMRQEHRLTAKGNFLRVPATETAPCSCPMLRSCTCTRVVLQ
jgi:hypothetical protein